MSKFLFTKINDVWHAGDLEIKESSPVATSERLKEIFQLGETDSNKEIRFKPYVEDYDLLGCLDIQITLKLKNFEIEQVFLNVESLDIKAIPVGNFIYDAVKN